MPNWRRAWPAAAMLLAVFAVAAFCVAVEQYAKPRPNYTRIEKGLWIGGHVAQPPPGCAAVLNVCELKDAYRTPAYQWQPIDDEAPSLDWLRRQVNFVASEHDANHGVFVHCQNGVNRSGLVMAAYLMRRHEWSRDRAIEFLKTRRPEVWLIPGYMQLLLQWESLAGDVDR